MFKSKKLGLLSLAASLAWAGTVTAASAEAAPALALQCVADQKTAVQGGKVSLHILYHNVQNKSVSQSWLKVKVPGGLEPEAAAGTEWDSVSGIFKINVKDIPGNGADVVHLNLKVKADVKDGQVLEVGCSADADGVQVPGLHPVKVKIGNEIHQPVFNGYEDGKFHPERSITRAETAAILARELDLTVSAGVSSYKDVPATHWASSYIKQVTAAGYMKGEGELFRPDEPITKSEFVVILLRVRGIQALPLNGFKDTVSHWAKQEAATAKALRFIDGNGKDSFEPDAKLRRDAAAKMFAIALYRGELVDGKEQVIAHWPDVPRNDWAFGWVEELSLVAHESAQQGLLKEKLIRYLPNQTEPF